MTAAKKRKILVRKPTLSLNQKRKMKIPRRKLTRTLLLSPDGK